MRAPIAFDRRDDEAALGGIRGAGHGAKPEQRAGLDRPVEQAGLDFADRDLPPPSRG